MQQGDKENQGMMPNKREFHSITGPGLKDKEGSEK